MKKIILIIIIGLIIIRLIFINIQEKDKIFIKNSAKNIAIDIVKYKGIEKLKKYNQNFNMNAIINENTQIILNNIFNKNNIIKKINSKLDTDDWIIMGYDNFINRLNNNFNINNVYDTTLNEEINNMIITAKNKYNIIYYLNNTEFPTIIGPYFNKLYEEMEISLKKIILEFINKEIKVFIDNFNINLLTPNLDSFINNYIISDPKYKDNFNKFSEDKLKPYIISELSKNIITIYNKKLEDVRTHIIENVKEILCNDFKGLYMNGECTFSNKEECDNVLLDSSSNTFTSYNNNKCITSSQLGLKHLVEKNTTNNDITYDSENEKVNINSQYCVNKGLEVIQDDCKFSKDKPMLESILGITLLNTINTKYDNKQYDVCNSNEIDAGGVIPDNLKKLLDPLVKKYGPIDKSLCIDKNYGCPADKELVNGLCYNKCPEGYKINPDNISECYKLYSDFENNGKQHDKNIITKNIIANPYLPKEICPSGYNYNKGEKKCITNCKTDFQYGGDKCIKKIPGKWDGKITNDTLNKNAIYSPSKSRVFKCTNPDKPNLIDGLCYANCPADHTRVPRMPYTCMPNTCPSGYHKTDVNTCYRHPHTYYRDQSCPSGYNNKEGICWQDTYGRGAGRIPDKKPCPPGQRDDGTSCWEDLGSSGYWNYTWGCGTLVKKCWDGRWNCHGDCYRTWIINGCGCIKAKASDRYQCNSNEVLRGALCYPACNSGYYESTVNICAYSGDHGKSTPATYGPCAPGYRTDLTTCHKDAHTHPNPNIGIGEDAELLCPDDTKEASPGGICYPKDAPDGYQRHSISIEQWTEKCPEGWTDTGWFCNRPSHSINKQDGECPTNYKDINNKCKKDCNSGYEFKDEKCIQKCPEKTINETETTCEREKMYIDNIDNNELPYKYRIKKRIKDYF